MQRPDQTSLQHMMMMMMFGCLFRGARFGSFVFLSQTLIQFCFWKADCPLMAWPKHESMEGWLPPIKRVSAGNFMQTDVAEWSCLDVAKWLKSLGFSSTLFLAQRVDGAKLVELSLETLPVFGIEDANDRRRLYKHIDVLRKRHSAPQTEHRQSVSPKHHDNSDVLSMAMTAPSVGKLSTRKYSRPCWRPGGAAPHAPGHTMMIPKTAESNNSSKSEDSSGLLNHLISHESANRRAADMAEAEDEPATLLQKLQDLFRDVGAFEELARKRELSHKSKGNASAMHEISPGEAGITLNEWQTVLEVAGIVPKQLSKTSAVHIYSKALRRGSHNGDMRMIDFQEALRLTALRLGLSVGTLSLPIREKKHVAGHGHLELGMCIAEDSADTVEKYIVARQVRDKGATLHEDTCGEGVGSFKLDYLRGMDEKLKRIRLKHEEHNVEVARTKEDLRRRMASLGIRPTRKMRV